MCMKSPAPIGSACGVYADCSEVEVFEKVRLASAESGGALSTAPTLIFSLALYLSSGGGNQVFFFIFFFHIDLYLRYTLPMVFLFCVRPVFSLSRYMVLSRVPWRLLKYLYPSKNAPSGLLPWFGICLE